MSKMNEIKSYIIECATALVGNDWEQSCNHPDLYTREEAERRVNVQRTKFSTKWENVHYRIVRVLPQSTDPIEILKSAREYLGDQAYAGARSMFYSKWYDAVGDALGIMYTALTDLEAEREEREEHESPIRPVVFIDMTAIENRLLRNSIADCDVQKLLPFQTTLGAGNNHVHIVNASAYDVKTSTHVIREGDTICARSGGVKWHLADLRDGTMSTCLSCLEKGKGIIIEHLRHRQTERL